MYALNAKNTARWKMTLRPTDTIRVRHKDLAFIQKILPPLKNESMADWLGRYVQAMKNHGDFSKTYKEVKKK